MTSTLYEEHIHGIINPLSHSIKIQILLTALHSFSYSIS